VRRARCASAGGQPEDVHVFREDSNREKIRDTMTAATDAQEGLPTADVFRWLALAAAVMTFLLIVVGGIVRVTGSGLGCPDWPLCHGQLIPPLEFTALIEYSHRLTASLTSPLILATTIVAWARYRRTSWVFWPSVASLALLVVQVLLGGVTVVMELPPTIVAAHLANALLILALQVLIMVGAFRLHQRGGRAPSFSLDDSLTRLAASTAATVFLLLVSGALVTSSGADAACAGWPLCDGIVWPSNLLGQIHMLHRFIAALAGLMVLGLAWAAWQRRQEKPPVAIAAVVTGVLLLAQVLVGAANVLRGFPPALGGLHVATATAVWGSLILTLALAGERPTADAATLQEDAPPEAPGSVGDYVALMKPIIVGLLLVTTLAAMIVAAKGWPDWGLVAWTMIGGTLAAGGSSALNQYIDRELDQRMQRTSRRPLPGGRLKEAEAIAFGLALSIGSFYILAVFVNLLSAVLALAGILYYVIFYSLGLKQATTHNIVIGGGAGAIPPLVGWAAATGGLSLGALFLFALVFFWTPPHFWALALVRRKDYARAGVPMLPVIYGERETRTEILLYTLQVVALTLLMPVADVGGWIYILLAVGLGGLLCYYAWQLFREGGNKSAWMMYRYSSLYLALIFSALVVDTLVRF
jgi:protoheme IX farnesyltransferase